MIRCFSFSIAAFVAFSMGTSAFASGDTAPKMPTPPPEVKAAAKKAVGLWECSVVETMMGGKLKLKGTMDYKLDPSEFFLVGTWKTPERKDLPAQSSVEYRTYDPSEEKWIIEGVDLGIGGWVRWTSSGRRGATSGVLGHAHRTSQWTGTLGTVGANGRTMALQMSQTEVGPREVKVTVNASMDGKNWMPFLTKHCRRSR